MMREAMMRRGWSRRQLLISTAATMGAAGFMRWPGDAAEFSWKFGCTMATDHPLTVRSTEAFQKLKADTNGRFEGKVFANNALGDDAAVMSQIRLGATEMSTMSGSVLDGVVPLASIENVAYAFPDQPTALRAMDGDVGKLIRDGFGSHGFLGFERPFQNGFRHFTCSTKPIRNADDLQGLKIRAIAGRLAVDTFRSFGASPTPIPAVQLYSSLQTHIIDAADGPLPLIQSQRWYELQKYICLSHHIWTSLWVVISQVSWNGLPNNLREAVRKRLDEAVVKERRDCVQLEGVLGDKLRREGLTFTPFDVASLKAKLVSNGYYARWRNEFGAVAWSALEKYSGPLG